MGSPAPEDKEILREVWERRRAAQESLPQSLWPGRRSPEPRGGGSLPKGEGPGPAPDLRGL